MILRLEEGLQPEEQPKPWVYIVPWELEKHLNGVQAERKYRMDNPNAPAATDFEDGSYDRNALVPDSWVGS